MSSAKIEANSKLGRRPKYRPEMIEKVKDLATKGATNYEMSVALGISYDTFMTWQKTKAEFSDAVKTAKEIVDQRVVKSLFERATGYSHEVTKVFLDRDGVAVKVPYTEHLPPDPTSMIFWLKNRQRGEWRDKQEVGVTDKDGNDVNLTIGLKKVE